MIWAVAVLNSTPEKMPETRQKTSTVTEPEATDTPPFMGSVTKYSCSKERWSAAPPMRSVPFLRSWQSDAAVLTPLEEVPWCTTALAWIAQFPAGRVFDNTSL